MRYKYFIKFKYKSQDRTTYITARSRTEAIIKLLERHSRDSITTIICESDALPARQDTAATILKKKEAARERKRKGAIKYYQLANKSVFDK